MDECVWEPRPQSGSNTSPFVGSAVTLKGAATDAKPAVAGYDVEAA